MCRSHRLGILFRSSWCNAIKVTAMNLHFCIFVDFGCPRWLLCWILQVCNNEWNNILTMKNERFNILIKTPTGITHKAFINGLTHTYVTMRYTLCTSVRINSFWVRKYSFDEVVKLTQYSDFSWRFAGKPHFQREAFRSKTTERVAYKHGLCFQ